MYLRQYTPSWYHMAQDRKLRELSGMNFVVGLINTFRLLAHSRVCVEILMDFRSSLSCIYFESSVL